MGTSNLATSDSERICKVCADRSDGAHFGVDSCRACAAFFRRSIVMRKKYVCRQGNHLCAINRTVRCMCRACRFRKCVRAGMSRDGKADGDRGVQSPCDQLGPREYLPGGDLPALVNPPPVPQAPHDLLPSPHPLQRHHLHMMTAPLQMSSVKFDMDSYGFMYSNSVTEQSAYEAMAATPCSEPTLFTPESATPLLDGLLRGYRELNDRRAAYRNQPGSRGRTDEQPSLFNDGYLDGVSLMCKMEPPSGYIDEEDYTPNVNTSSSGSPPTSVAVSYLHVNELIPRDYEFLLQFIGRHFPRLTHISSEQKRLLCRCFWSQFYFLECAARTASVRPGHSDQLILSDFNFIDVNDLRSFFSSPHGDQQMNAEEAERMFRPSFDLYIASILVPLHKLQLSEVEVVVLMALCFYSLGIDGVAQSTEELCRQVRDELFRELMLHYEQQSGGGRGSSTSVESAVRLAHVIMLIPAIQRVATRHMEDLLITNIFMSQLNESLYRMFASP